jgi:uncharacterized protein Yka (UPF0111/DUF47 family)
MDSNLLQLIKEFGINGISIGLVWYVVQEQKNLAVLLNNMSNTIENNNKTQENMNSLINTLNTNLQNLNTTHAFGTNKLEELSKKVDNFEKLTYQQK